MSNNYNENAEGVLEDAINHIPTEVVQEHTNDTEERATNNEKTEASFVAKDAKVHPIVNNQPYVVSSTPQYSQPHTTIPQQPIRPTEQNIQSSFIPSPNHVYPQYPQSYVSPTGATPNPNKKEKKKAGGSKIVAAVLAASLLGGGAGSGMTYYLMNKNKQELPAVVLQQQTEADRPLTANSASSIHTGVSGIVEKALPTVVEVSTETKTTNGFFGDFVVDGAGSGVIISADGYIVTNNHVVEGASSITIRTNDGEEYQATLVGRDVDTDLAVLKIEEENVPFATFADSDKLQVGDLAIVVGNPLGTLGGTVTDGIVSALNREITIDNQTMTLIQTSAAVNRGNSGGGLFDANGNLAGVINAKSSGAGIEGLGFAIPANLAKDVIAQIIEVGYVTGRPQLGISVMEVDNDQMAVYYSLPGQGIYVASVTAENGLKSRDRIISIDDKEITSFDDVKNILAEKVAKDIVIIKIERDGVEQDVKVELTEKLPEHVQESFNSQENA